MIAKDNIYDNYLFINTAFGIEVFLKYKDNVYYKKCDDTLQASQILLCTIDEILKKANAKIENLDFLGVCVGPGSFTGIRIGIMTIKAFAMSCDLPIIAIDSLFLNISDKFFSKKYKNISEYNTICSILEEGNACYYCIYDNKMQIVMQSCCYKKDVLDAFKKDNVGIVFCTTKELSDKFNFELLEFDEQRIKCAIDEKVKNNSFCDYLELEPLYIRKPQPERGVGDI